MHRTLKLCSIPLMVFSLLAQEPSWKEKPVSQWSDADAKQVLTDSPWVKQVTPQNIRDLSPDERREGGNMEASPGHGVGLAGLGILGPRREAEAIARAHYKPTPDAVMIRWESARPVRAAEQKAGEVGIPASVGDYYAIAVYDVHPPFRWNLPNQLKGLAFLKRNHKKDLKPARVEVLPHDSGLVTAVYLFPRSAGITKKDGRVQFVAQIGRLYVSQFFDLGEMQFEGKLEY